MKITEDEAKAKLEQVGLPIYGTHDELIERLERNGLIGKHAEVKFDAKDGFSESSVKPVLDDQPRRGRPKMGTR